MSNILLQKLHELQLQDKPVMDYMEKILNPVNHLLLHPINITLPSIYFFISSFDNLSSRISFLRYLNVPWTIIV